jgi:hypothetical protein
MAGRWDSAVVGPSSRLPSPNLTGMERASAGELVKVAAGSAQLDGIVFDVPSTTKVIVAVVDPTRGPLFRTVNANTLTERTEEGPNDRALRLLVRRTPPPAHGAGRGATGGGQSRSGSGFKRDAAHRPTGR